MLHVVRGDYYQIKVTSLARSTLVFDLFYGRRMRSGCGHNDGVSDELCLTVEEEPLKETT